MTNQPADEKERESNTHNPKGSTIESLDSGKNLADEVLEKVAPTSKIQIQTLDPDGDAEIYTARKHSMDYFTVDGVILRTGYSHKEDWFLLCIRELSDNAADFLVKNYKGADNTVIAVEIFKDDDYFRLKLRNTNYKDIPVFQNKAAIFDYDMRYGSKQDVHIISRGMLGDAMKQILAFGYILIHAHDDDASYNDQQWLHPLIIRHNRKEFKINLKVNKIKQIGVVTIDDGKDIASVDTEVELVLPITDDVRYSLTKKNIVDFCRKYPIFTTDITFRFNITDNSTPPRHIDVTNHTGVSRVITDSEGNREDIMLNAIGSTWTESILNLESPRGTTKIEYGALHPISSEVWNKQNSIWFYTREEFRRRIINIDPRQVAYTQIYNILTTYREGSNLPKKREHEISVAELLRLPEDEIYERIDHFYDQLRNALPAPTKLYIPYTSNKEERKETLITRLETLHPNTFNQDHKKASYKSIHALYEDKKRGICFPYFFEILAVPVADPIHTRNGIVYFGAVNYSIPSKDEGIVFEGDYYKHFPDAFIAPKHILGVLRLYKFNDDAEDSSKVPCIVIANLVTPRRDPHGQDKARIDTTPFTDTIIKAVSRISTEIKSYRAEGYYFTRRSERHTTTQQDTGRGQIEKLLTEYLRREHGLPI